MMWLAPCVAALRLNLTPLITCYHPFKLYLSTFYGMSDCILNKNIILYIILCRGGDFGFQ